MKVIVPAHSGFCPGVKNAERRLFEEGRNSRSAISVYGQLIHNSAYTAYLGARGVRTVDSLSSLQDGSTVVIRTHGIPREQEKEMRTRFRVLDLTCSKVKRLQLLIAENTAAGRYAVITGKKSHPETRGLVSYAKRCSVVESIDDLHHLAERRDSPLRKHGDDGVFVVSQTTGDRILFETTIRKLSECFSITDSDSICTVTELRERAAMEMQGVAHLTLVVGDALSSNAGRLYDRLRENDNDTYFVDGLETLKSRGIPVHADQTIQVVSSSSTPAFVEQEIISFLEDL